MFIKSLRYALSKWLHDNYFNVTVKRVFGFLNASASRSIASYSELRVENFQLDFWIFVYASVIIGRDNKPLSEREGRGIDLLPGSSGYDAYDGQQTKQLRSGNVDLRNQP